MSAPPLLSTLGLVVGYGRTPVARVPDLEIRGGVVWSVVGPNGSGKTTLLKTLGGLLPPVDGRIDRPCGIGTGGAVYVHSVPYVFAGTVRRNLGLAASPPHARELAGRFGLVGLLDRDARTLSHGQQRRLGLARALAADPVVLLVDEPEGGLDDEAVAAWRSCASAAAAAGRPALMVAAHQPVALGEVPILELRL